MKSAHLFEHCIVVYHQGYESNCPWVPLLSCIMKERQIKQSFFFFGIGEGFIYRGVYVTFILQKVVAALRIIYTVTTQ